MEAIKACNHCKTGGSTVFLLTLVDDVNAVHLVS